MGTTEVQRTLVKSAPELWSELSDQGSLGRLLSDLGEVRIVSTVAETAVYWEGDDVTGSALIQQAGWGTKVTLTVTLEAPDTSPEHPDTPVLAAVGASVAPSISLTAAALRATEPSSPQQGTGSTSSTIETTDHPGTSPITDTPDPPAHDAASVPDTESAGVPEPPAAPPDTAERTSGDGGPTRRGFFARLFGRRSRQPKEPVQPRERPEAAPSTEPDTEPDAPATALEALQARYGVRPAATEPSAPTATTPVPAVVPSAPTPPTQAEAAPSEEGPAETPPEPTTPPDLSSELRSAEEIPAGDVKAGPTEDQVKEILTGVLDRLGAAHHRPFSRA